MSSCRILILTALLIEARAIARAFSLPSDFATAVASKGDLTVAMVGPRAVKLNQVTCDIQPQAMIMAGLAGALSSELAIGDIVAEGVISSDFRPPNGVRLYRGKLHTSEVLVATPREKRALFAATGALAVDMETHQIKAFASNRNLPFLALRSISDAACDELNPALLKMVDQNGRPRLRNAAAYAAARPWKVAELLRIQRASNSALSHLTAIIVALLASGWPENPTIRQSE